MFDPYKYRSPLYVEGDSDAVFSQKCLDQLDEILMYEGPQTVAAIFVETVTGTNGLIVPPEGYMQGLRALCDKYGILLICDEVMAGLGRTGAWFAVDHWNVVPDIMTMAKGLTSAYLPLGAVAISKEDRRLLPGPHVLRRPDIQRPPDVPGGGGGYARGAARG